MSLANDIAARWERHIAQRQHKQTQTTLRASSIGHPCDRKLFYDVLPPAEPAAPDAGLIRIFEAGNDIERLALRRLEDLGFRVTDRQLSTKHPDYPLTGHIDCIIEDADGRRWVVDIKSCGEGTWRNIHTASDVRDAREPWVRAYWWQMHAYMMMLDLRQAMILFVRKQDHDWRPVAIDADLDSFVALGEKLRRLDTALSTETEPARLDEVDTCEECPWRVACAPPCLDASHPPVALDMPNLLAALEARAAAEPAAKQWEEADKAAKEIVRAALPPGTTKFRALAGRWMVSASVSERAGYTVPPSTTTSVRIREEGGPR